MDHTGNDSNIESNPPTEDFSDMETPEELLAHQAPAPLSTAEREPLPPPLDRQRPTRAPIVPRWLLIAAAAVPAIALMIAAGAALYVNSSMVEVPDVTGSQIGLARTNLIQAGLTAEISEERFSSQPEGEVLSQSPRAGSERRKGTVVFLVVSAGTEEFPMPDVVGNGLALARGSLEARGLVIQIEEVVSTTASGTVLGTVPAAGAMVRSGDVVRVTIATTKPSTSGLEPFRMDGLAFVIDPAPVPEGESDVTLEVARRLRALLEASGAVVTVLRTGLETSTADAARSAAVAETSATAAVGLSVDEAGPLGRVVRGPAVSGALMAKTQEKLGLAAPPASTATVSADPVLSSFSGPWLRVVLGSPIQRTDKTSFSDPRWADQVARAIYGALGEVYGRKEGM